MAVETCAVIDVAIAVMVGVLLGNGVGVEVGGAVGIGVVSIDATSGVGMTCETCACSPVPEQATPLTIAIVIRAATMRVIITLRQMHQRRTISTALPRFRLE